MKLRRAKAENQKPIFDDEFDLDVYRMLYNRIAGIPLSIIKEGIADLENSKTLDWAQKEKKMATIMVKVKPYVKNEVTLNELTSRISEHELRQKKVEYFEKRNPSISIKDELGELFRQYSRNLRIEKECKVSQQEVTDANLNRILPLLKQYRECLEKCGLKDNLISRRSESYELFHVILKFKNGKKAHSTDVEVNLTRSELEQNFTEPYNLGYDIVLHGATIERSTIISMQIYKCKLKKDEIPLFLKRHGHKYDEKSKSSRRLFAEHCENVTRQYINTKYSVLKNSKEYYVNPERINELKSIRNDRFSLVKLIQICEELNIAKRNSTLYTPPMLVRTICDHIPPIFGKAQFHQVATEYRPEGTTDSFPRQMKRLNEFMRPNANSALHSAIRSRENLPTADQVDMSNELDVLLQEICRVLL